MMECGCLLPFVFVVAGTTNVLLMKWVDWQVAECADGKPRPFQHPIIQTWFMFAGEFLCFLVYKIAQLFNFSRQNGSSNYNIITRGSSDFSPVALLLPSALDALSSFLLFMGLYLTYVSSFDLIRMAVTIFVGVFASMHLNQRLVGRHWLSFVTIAIGTLIIILFDLQRIKYDTVSVPHADVKAMLTGDMLILIAQIFKGAQYVYEEKLLKVHDISPMQAVGWQGIFGLLIVNILGVCMNYLPSVAPFNENGVFVVDSFENALAQMAANELILGALIIFAINSAIFNFTGRYIMKSSSSANLLLAESMRAFYVWTLVTLLQWEQIGFATVVANLFLIVGLMSYRTAVITEYVRSIVARMQSRGLSVRSVSRPEPIINSSSCPADVI